MRATPSSLTLLGPVSLLSWAPHSQESDPLEEPNSPSSNARRSGAPPVRASGRLWGPHPRTARSPAGSPCARPAPLSPAPFPAARGPAIRSLALTLLSPCPSRVASELSPPHAHPPPRAAPHFRSLQSGSPPPPPPWPLRSPGSGQLLLGLRSPPPAPVWALDHPLPPVQSRAGTGPQRPLRDTRLLKGS